MCATTLTHSTYNTRAATSMPVAVRAVTLASGAEQHGEQRQQQHRIHVAVSAFSPRPRTCHVWKCPLWRWGRGDGSRQSRPLCSPVRPSIRGKVGVPHPLLKPAHARRTNERKPKAAIASSSSPQEECFQLIIGGEK